MNIAIIDDLYQDRQTIIGYLQTYFSNRCPNMPFQLAQFSGGQEFLDHMAQGQYDILFIDCYMEGLSGLETAQRIRAADRTVAIIFMTVSRDFAIDSYKVKASGYLVKPFEYQELCETMALIDLKEIRDRQFIELDQGNGKLRVILKQVIYCDVSGHYTHIHSQNKETMNVRMSFSEIVARLKPFPEFLVCYRGCIVNMGHIIKIEDAVFLMTNGERIPFRRKQQAKILDSYSEFLFHRARSSTI